MILVHNNRLVRVRGKANNSETIRDDPLIVMRHGLADRWFAKYRKEMYKQLSAQILESSKLVEGGSTEPTTDAMEVRWTQRLLRAKRPLVTAMVRSGTELTDTVQFGKSMNYFPGVLGPGVNPFALEGKADPVGLEYVGYDADDVFLHQAQTQNVEAYLQATSKSETATSRKEIDKLYKDANSYWDETLQRGFTPQQMARAMRQQGLADSVQRANLMARTTTMWSYNEGAMQSYINAGVPVMSWVTSNDDVLCFPKGTMISTPSGQIPIQKIKVGDVVKNAIGIGKVLATGVRNHTEKMTVFVAGENTIYCTSNHPIFVKDSGWIDAEDLNVGNLVQLSNNEFTEILCSVNFLVGYPDNRPSIFLKVSRLASILCRVIMPVCPVRFKSYFKFRNNKVNASTANFSFLNERNLQSFKRFPNRSLKSILSSIFSVTGFRTKDSVGHRRSAELLSASFTSKIFRRTVAFFGAIFVTPDVALEHFPASCALDFAGVSVPAFPTADNIPVGNIFRYGKGFATYWANLRDHFRSMGKVIAFSTTEFSVRQGVRSVKPFFTMLARNFLSGTRALVIAFIRTISSWPAMRMVIGPKSFSALFTFPRFHGSLLLILSRILYHVFTGKSTVFNLQIEKSPTYFANNVLVHNCEFCVQMDGQMIRTGDPFVPAGTELVGLEGGTLNIPEEWSIGHPPLHPMCRCTLVPIIVETDVAVIRAAADKLKEDYTKKVADGTLKDARARRGRLLRSRRKKKPKPPRRKPPTKKEPSEFKETKQTKKTLEKKPKAVEKKPARKELKVREEKPILEKPGATKEELERILNKERQLAKSFSNEHASIIDPKSGEVILRKEGTSDAVKFTKSEIKKMNGRIQVHNHPGHGLNFSTDDIMFLSKHGLQETQVITDKFIYKMLRVKGRKAASPTEIRRVFNKQMRPVMKELAAKYRGATLTADEAGALGIHNLWRSIAKDLGLNYKRILI